MSLHNFQITSDFKGYWNKRDKTNIPGGGVLVSGSQNVVSTDGENIAIRNGYTLYGQAAAGVNPVVSSYEWDTYRGVQHALRSWDDELEFYDSNTSTWVRLRDSLTAVDFNFAEYWDTTENQDILLFVNGTSNVFYWSGGTTTFASATGTTITKQGVTTWGEQGFLVAGTRQVIIGGITYTYTGGESTTTLTGVTPDPTLGGHSSGNTVFQAVRTTANSAITDLPDTFENDLIAVLDNQVWIGSEENRQVYVSVVGNYLTFAFATPRLVSQGALLTLDQTPKAFVVEEEAMYISAGDDFWYNSQIILSEDLTRESLQIKRLKTTPLQGALSQGAVGKIKNAIVFISNEPTLDSLGRVENINTPQSRPISDPIKADFDDYDFTNAHVKFFKNNLYIAVPVESRLLIYNIEKGFWEAPWILPVRRLAIIGGNLYIHSNAVEETYRLFQGYNDNALAINAIAKFNYLNYGERARKKTHTEWFSEGYIAANTSVTLTLNYELDGSVAAVAKSITGDTSQNTIFEASFANPLGGSPLGGEPIGGPTTAAEDINKFRIIHEMPPLDYYEIQPVYSSNGIDLRWELLAYGSDAVIANKDNFEIKQ